MKRLGSVKLDDRPSALRKICGECGGMNPIEAQSCWKCKKKLQILTPENGSKVTVRTNYTNPTRWEMAK
jgi:hypothetical protein